MRKWTAEFELEDGDTMPEHMDLEYMGAKIDFYCRPMWIPVTEGLPKAGTRYQVTFESGEVGYADFRNKIFLWDGSVKENVWETERYYEDDGEVIAWMPLPKRYERSNICLIERSFTKSRQSNETSERKSADAEE